jgi:UDP-N-acetylmuramate--alanine ligase
MKIIFSGGGTGGSVSPLLAIAQELRKRGVKEDFIFLGTKYGPEKKLVQNNNIKFQVISAGKLRRYFDIKNFTDLFRIIKGFFQSLRIINRFKPDIILSAGSFVSVPVVWAAWFLGFPSIIHQQDVRVGLANKLMAPFAKIITVAFEKSQKDFSTKKTVLTGNPVRPEITSGSSEKARRVFNLKNDLKTILVLGGGTGSLRINQIISSASLKLVNGAQIIHLTGVGRGTFTIHHENYHSFNFLTAEIADALAIADIVISRAGLSTLTELAILKKPSIIIPIPGSHQEDNAQIFAQEKAAIVIPEDKLSTELLVEKINYLLDNPEWQKKLSLRIKEMAKPEALERITEIVLKFAKEKSLIDQAKKIHFVGVGGFGVSGLAKILVSKGKVITGSDLTETSITRGLGEIGVKIIIGQHKEENLDGSMDLVIKSNAVLDDNPEIKKAEDLKIKIFSYPEALADLTRNKYLIAISGMHGKSTVTSLIGQILIKADLKPSILVGALVKEFNGNAVVGKGEYFVLEADEYARAFLNYSPRVIVLTRVEPEHLDVYHDLDDILETFKKYVMKLTSNNLIVANADDDNIMQIVKDCPAQVVTYGIKRGVFRANQIEKTSKGLKFTVDNLDVRLKVFGYHNVYNALAAIALAQELKIDKTIIKNTLENFQGISRRFEKVGYFRGCPVISDYAHHPTEIKASLEMAKDTYPDKRIVLVYRPHQRNRTKKLFLDFVTAFDQADLIVMNEIYEVAGREQEKDMNISSMDLVREIKKRNKEIYYSKDLAESEKLVQEKLKNNDVIIVMGAGDIYLLAEKLVKK